MRRRVPRVRGRETREYLNGTRDDVLTICADNLKIIKLYVDVTFAVHPDFKEARTSVFVLYTLSCYFPEEFRRILTKNYR